MDEEKTEELKRQTMNAGDAEMDRGHKKKLGSKLVLGRDNPGYNPFQECQNSRNTWTVSNGSSNSTNQSPRPFKSQVFRQKPKHNFHSKFRSASNGGGRNFGNGYRHGTYNRQLNK